MPTLHSLVDDDTPLQIVDDTCDAATRDSRSLTCGSNGPKRQHYTCPTSSDVNRLLPANASAAGCSNARVLRFQARGVTWGLSRPIYALGKVEFFVFGHAFNDNSVETVAWPPRVKRLVFDIQLERMECGQPALHERLRVQPTDWRQRAVARLTETAGVRGVFHLAARRSGVAGVLGRGDLRVEVQPRTRGSSMAGVLEARRSRGRVQPWNQWRQVARISASALRKLSFHRCFDQPLEMAEWPSSPREVPVGWNFNHPIWQYLRGTLLTRITFEVCFNQEIEQVKWPSSVENLAFGKSFIHCIEATAWPPSLEQLTFGNSFDWRITAVRWSSSHHLWVSVQSEGRRRAMASLASAAGVRKLPGPAH